MEAPVFLTDTTLLTFFYYYFFLIEGRLGILGIVGKLGTFDFDVFLLLLGVIEPFWFWGVDLFYYVFSFFFSSFFYFFY